MLTPLSLMCASLSHGEMLSASNRHHRRSCFIHTPYRAGPYSPRAKTRGFSISMSLILRI